MTLLRTIRLPFTSVALLLVATLSCVDRNPAAPASRPRLSVADTARRDVGTRLSKRLPEGPQPLAFEADSACPEALRATVIRCARSAATGHWYAVLPQKLYHGEAATTAATLPTIDGAGPALATITTPDEHAFVLTQVLANLEQPMPEDAPLDAYWLGATAPGGDGSLRTGWVWTNGEAWDYAPWDGGEPNNENETALSIWGAFAERPFGTWNNLLPAAREDNPLHRVWALVDGARADN